MRTPAAASLLVVLLVGAPAAVQAQPTSPEAQIRSAVHAAPAEWRDGAGVLGYAADGRLITLRAGTNDLLCLADAPGDDRFEVSCYHRSLEPFMARGRALRAEGKDRAEIMETREREARAGTLEMPDGAAALYVHSGGPDDVDAATGEVTGGRLRYVVYIPYATEATTGLSAQGAPGKPWIMDAGKPWAHIMLIPAQ